MKLNFKIQSYQTDAVESIVDCFLGQTDTSKISYRIDPGKGKEDYLYPGLKNAELQLTDKQLIDNIHAIQVRQNLPLSEELVLRAECKINLDVEMETGTGKTYCYIKTIFEMNRRYGWSKFIIVVPSIAIREGVSKSLEITTDHFAEIYGKKVRFFIYDSKQLHCLESFSSDSGINVMIINVQAFNATGKDHRRIYEELDDFQSRRPIDVISRNRPILILDEPQKMEGTKTLEALAKFKPLMILRYSATHRTAHNKVYQLDALDAYNQRLVKKISVRGIAVRGLAGSNGYLYLERIEISEKAPKAYMEMEVRKSGGIKRMIRSFQKGDNLFDVSGGLDQYRGFVVSEIDARSNTVAFSNGQLLTVCEAVGDVTEETLRRIQIRETIKAHLDKEGELFSKGIKVLSLFFIDEVVKYRDYGREDEKGDYARMFEEEYENLKAECLGEGHLDGEYRKHLGNIPTSHTHSGYFSIDKKTKRLTDPSFKVRGEGAGISDDTDAYDLILKDKERLLSFEEPVRFIFSHSALREGWDNPNIFVMCMLKQSNSMISRRQEVGRGLRLSVDRNGDRMDHPAVVHDINILTVIPSESYKKFVIELQKEFSDSLSARPRKADESYFIGKPLKTENGLLRITNAMAKQIHRFLLKNDYVNEMDQITEKYHKAKDEGNLVAFPPELISHAQQILGLIDNVFSESQLPEVVDDRKLKINHQNIVNIEKREFKKLWNSINRKAVYRVEFNSDELITNCAKALNDELEVSLLQYTIQAGIQDDHITDSQLKSGDGFRLRSSREEKHDASIHSMVQYDLLGRLAGNTQLTRKTVAGILKGIRSEVFTKFRQNPEHFIAEATRLINEQKATIIIERLSYDETDDSYDMGIFTATKQDLSRAVGKLQRHIYDYAITDSKIEREFVEELDTCEDVVVYAKLPRGFLIPTPVGDYNPDWAISFKEGSVNHIYFVAETKGSMSTMNLRSLEQKKIGVLANSSRR